MNNNMLLPRKTKRQYLLTLQVSRYFLLALQDSIGCTHALPANIRLCGLGQLPAPLTNYVMGIIEQCILEMLGNYIFPHEKDVSTAFEVVDYVILILRER